MAHFGMHSVILFFLFCSCLQWSFYMIFNEIWIMRKYIPCADKHQINIYFSVVLPPMQTLSNVTKPNTIFPFQILFRWYWLCVIWLAIGNHTRFHFAIFHSRIEMALNKNIPIEWNVVQWFWFWSCSRARSCSYLSKYIYIALVHQIKRPNAL